MSEESGPTGPTMPQFPSGPGSAWKIATVVLGIMLIASIVITSGGITGMTTIDKDAAGTKAISYINNNFEVQATLVNITESNGLYMISMSITDRPYLMYMSKDGALLFPQVLMLADAKPVTPAQTQTQPAVTIPKSDKLSIELYVFTYCPYGTQAEKGMLPVVELLGDKIDFKIRQIGAMHGEYEKIEAERQLCIEKNYPAKFLDYVLAFAEDTAIGNCKGDATCVAPLLKTLYSKFGIDSAKIDTCMKSEGETLYNAEVSNANSKGVGGSPTLIINGVEVPIVSNAYAFNDQNIPFARDSETYKQVVCSLFDNKPSDCSQVLSTAPPSPGFGTGAGTSGGSCG